MILQEVVSKNIPVSIDYVKKDVPFDNSRLHYHPYNEISVVSHGNISYSTSEENIKTTDNCIIFSKAHQLHNPFLKSPSTYERYQVKFYDDLITDSITDAKIVVDAHTHSYLKPVSKKRIQRN